MKKAALKKKKAFHQRPRQKFKEETTEIIYFGHSFLQC
jgi:hypothetical protein